MEKHPEFELVEELSSKLKEKLGRRAQENGKYPTLENGKANWLGEQTSMEALYYHTKSEYHEMCSKMESIFNFYKLLLVNYWDVEEKKKILPKLKKRIDELDEETMDLAILSRMTLDRVKDEFKKEEEEIKKNEEQIKKGEWPTTGTVPL